jgi:hypothetical protein
LLETDDEENIDDFVDGSDSDGENAETTKIGDDDDDDVDDEENAVAAMTTTTATAMEDVLVLDFDAAAAFRTIIGLHSCVGWR